jgi:hypothetical protein
VCNEIYQSMRKYQHPPTHSPLHPCLL